MQDLRKLLNYKIEKSYGQNIVVGIDEAGRGPLAGPVVSACVMLDEKIIKNHFFRKVNDSKKMTKKIRKEIFQLLKENVKYGVGIVDEKIIDEINILQATKLSMFKAYQDLKKKYKISPNIILVDGNFAPFILQDKIKEIKPIVKGDTKCLSIACASIIAKETRDEIMLELHQKYPHFSWDKNSAYATKFHLDKIIEFGFCEYHRKSFEPIKSMANNIKVIK